MKIIYILYIVLSTWNHEKIETIRIDFGTMQECEVAEKALTERERMYLHVNMHGCFKSSAAQLERMSNE